MQMKMQATSFVANTRQGSVDLRIGGRHQGEAVTLHMQFATDADGSLSESEMLDAAWLRAQQILRCATSVARPAGRLGRMDRAGSLDVVPDPIVADRASTPLQVVHLIVSTPDHPSSWS